MKTIKIFIQLLIVFIPFVLNICAFLPLIPQNKDNHLFFYWTAILVASEVFIMGYVADLFGKWFDSKLK